jgi:hypothetical protein
LKGRKFGSQALILREKTMDIVGMEVYAASIKEIPIFRSTSGRSLRR